MLTGLTRTSAPLTKTAKLAVVSLAEVKAQAHITSSDEDSLIEDDIEAAYDFLSGQEGWLNGCCLLNEEWEAYGGPRLPASFELPLRPASAVSLDYLGADGVTYGAVAADIWAWMSEPSSASRIYRATVTPWPFVDLTSPKAFRVRFTAGFGTTKEAVPSPLRKAIKMLAAYWYGQRETAGLDGRSVGREVEYGLVKLAGRYRFHKDHG